MENKHEIIPYGENAYMWTVTDSKTKECWIFYDGENARNFAANLRTGNQLFVETKKIEDMQED